MLYRHENGSYTLSSPSPEGPVRYLTCAEGHTYIEDLILRTPDMSAEWKLFLRTTDQVGFIVS